MLMLDFAALAMRISAHTGGAGGIHVRPLSMMSRGILNDRSPEDIIYVGRRNSSSKVPYYVKLTVTQIIDGNKLL